MNSYNSTYLPDIMHDIAQGLLVPTMVVIVALIIITLFFIGQILIEFFTERRHYRVKRAQIVNEIEDASYGDVSTVITRSELLRFQKAALVTVARNMGLPEDALFSLAQMEVNNVSKHYMRRMAWTDTIAKIGPMLGLMGTLIPLGPGIADLGTGDVTGLSQSLLIAFDATVCGLVCAIIALIVSKVRSRWYSEYVETLESVMTCVVEKASLAREEGVALPRNYTDDALDELLGRSAKAETDEGGEAR